MVRRRRSDFTVVHCETRKRLASLLRAGGAPSSSVVTVVDVFSDAFGPCCVLPGILQDLTWNGTADGTRLQLALVDCARVLETTGGEGDVPAAHRLLCPPPPSQACVPPAAAAVEAGGGADADAGDDGASDGSSTDDDESSSGASCDVRGTPTDADPSVWSPLVTEQQERSQPLVLVYKDGCLLERIRGCRTALIRKAVGPLVCRESATQAGCLKQNQWLARLWEDAFGPGAAEAQWAAFLRLLRAGWLRLGGGAPCFSDADVLALAEKLRARLGYGCGDGAGTPPPLPARRSRDEHLAALWRNGVVELRLVAAFVVGEPRAEDGGGEGGGVCEGFVVVETAVARLLPQFMRRVRVWRDAKGREEGKGGTLRSALKGERAAAAETTAAGIEKGEGGGGGDEEAKATTPRRVTFQDAVTTHLPHDDSRGTEGGEPSQGGGDRPEEERLADAAVAAAADGSVGAVGDASTFTPVP